MRGEISMKIKDPFNPTFNEEYELILSIGNKRFGSECKHEKVKGNRCVNCLRKVVVSHEAKGSRK